MQDTWESEQVESFANDFMNVFSAQKQNPWNRGKVCNG